MTCNVSLVRDALVHALSFRVWKFLILGTSIAQRIFISQLWKKLLCIRETFRLALN